MDARRYEGPIGLGYGALAGVIAGLMMAMIAMIATMALGMGLMAMPNMIGGLILGPAAAMAGGMVVTIVGLMLHMMLSAIFGMIYAVIVNRLTHEALVTGVVFGMALWLVNFYMIGSIVPSAANLVQHDPVFLAVLTHLVYGIVLGIAGLTGRALRSVAG